MLNLIFCSNCGSPSKLSDETCKCGNKMSLSEKNGISDKFSKIESFKLITKSPKNAVSNALKKIPEYTLDKKYYKGSSAKRDYKTKVEFIKDNLIPQITEWKNIVQEADTILAKDKVELYGRILGITEFIINDYFGQFRVKNNDFQIFEEYRDFSKYELSKVMHDYNIELDDIQTTNFETIGIDVFNSISDTLHNGSFLELADKDKITDSDLKKVKTEVGAAIAGEVIKGITNMVSQNSDAIRNVRMADSNLNEKLSHISNVYSSLRIEEQEINKNKQLFDKSDAIIDTCYINILKPVVEELKKDQTYILYENERIPFLQKQNKIEIENQALNVNVQISFWSCLLSTAKSNFNKYLKERLQQIDSFEDYNLLNDKLKEKKHSSLKAKKLYETNSLEAFIEFEKEHRNKLKKIPAYVNNYKTVVKFNEVLKQVKTNIKK
ncbi:hypothetical protein [Algibacter sp. Ld11]|uniref:hypothetical protein n=1 Tax=Algibacter sp. Ld11 TaxID=649150 RepID=UPI0038691728